MKHMMLKVLMKLEEYSIWSSMDLIYEYIIILSVFHFSMPFMMNLISTIILIIIVSRQQEILHSDRTYR
jgi:hypothetical protein